MTNSSSYIGRFAPSPSGPLHFGSLITALASYLQARSQNGKWLLRIDDIDPPREMPGASGLIMNTLTAHGMEWDDSVILQSIRQQRYEEALAQLSESGDSYYCRCTRKDIKAAGGVYPETCRTLSLNGEGCALRFANDAKTNSIEDKHLGHLAVDPLYANEDFIIRRKDGLIAYHLASVVDDIDYGITEIVRGADLLEPSACQISLFNTFNAPVPDFVHIPVVASSAGQKLSKQNHAKAINNDKALDNLILALRLLGQPTDSLKNPTSVSKLLDQAINNWSLANVPKQREIVIASDIDTFHGKTS